MSDSHTIQLGFSALVPLDNPAALVPRTIQRAFADLSPRACLTMEARATGDSRQALSAEVDGHRMICALFDGPAPEPDLSRAASQSVFWRAAPHRIAGHGAFLFVAAERRAPDRLAARAQAAALTRLLGALCEAMPARAVHWRDADTLSAPGRLVQAVRELDRPRWPVDAWIGCRVRGDDPTAPTVVSLASRGAAALLGFEIELPPFPAAEKLRPLRILYGATAALLGRNEAIGDGMVVMVRGERPPAYRLRIGRTGTPPSARLVPVTRGGARPAGGLAAQRRPG